MAAIDFFSFSPPRSELSVDRESHAAIPWMMKSQDDPLQNSQSNQQQKKNNADIIETSPLLVVGGFNIFQTYPSSPPKKIRFTQI